VPIKTEKWYTTQLVSSESDKYFVFGDNSDRRGTGGQAKVCRGQPNVIGVITKRHPNYNYAAYYWETDFDEWLATAQPDLDRVEDELKKGKTVVVPADGIGTGLALLPRNAPSIHKYITEFFERMKETYGEDLTS